GFIPTESYPAALANVGGDLFIAAGKGRGTGPNNAPGQGAAARRNFTYIASLLYGSLARLPLRDLDAQLLVFTEQVLANNLFNEPSPSLPEGFRKIKHVIYVVKENRSYDQVLGDL